MTNKPFYESLGNITGSPFIAPDIPIVRADREKCPVCGHPKGDCTDGSYEAPDHIVGVAPGEEMVYVKEDITEEREISANVTTRVLLVPGGTYITKRRALELGIT